MTAVLSAEVRTSDPVAAATRALLAGRPIGIVGSAGPGVVDVLVPAATATPATVAWLVRHTSGLISAPMTAARAARLRIPAMYPGDGVAGVSVDATDGIGTGINAADRSRTLGLLADPGTRDVDLVRPGHVLPLIARSAEALIAHRFRPGCRAEAAVALLGLAGCVPVGAAAELLAADGSLGDVGHARELGLALVEPADIVRAGGAIEV